MLLLVGGFAILCGLLLLAYLFVNTDPARLARNLKWTGIGIAALALLALAISGRIFLLVGPAALLIPLFRRLRARFGGFRSAGSAGAGAAASSTVASDYLRMTLDHETGAMTGTVLRGRFTGMRVEELSRDDRLALLRECRAADEDGARLLEAYLDRVEPDWRDRFNSDDGPRANSRSSGDPMTVAEAYAILGLEPGADGAAIKAAHHRLMQKYHPDHGGSDYFAAKINRARDLLIQQ